ncbi:MAG: DUF2703 domain-containing protein [Deltaproteobacteria bacterium]|nr:DUF2703 domain-containing protein [Deltaproteobacteria bacterium]
MKELVIEWRHLDSDGETCERCGDTGAALRETLEGMSAELREKRVEVRFTETRLGPDRIEESNLVLLNGVPLEQWLPGAVASENACGSCSDLLGMATCCRTVEIDGVTHEALPPDLIREAVLRAATMPRAPEQSAT